MTVTPQDDSRRALTLPAMLALATFVYVFWFRTHGISASFVLRGDQIRDWTVALRRFVDLPLSGVPSSAGGTTLGPAYYWFLWLSARLVGPFVDFLPHAGGIAIAAAQSLADTVLLLALLRRFKSPVLVLAIIIGIATSAYDAMLSAMVWNPPLAHAFAKLAIAAILWNHDASPLQVLAAVASAWLAVQCHTAGVLVMIPVASWLVLAAMLKQRWRVALQRVAMIVAVIGVLQLPWFIYRLTSPPDGAGQILSSLTSTFAAPHESFHIVASTKYVVSTLEFLIAAPYTSPLIGAGLVIAIAASVATVRDFTTAVMCVAPLITGVVLFAIWQGRLDQPYWCLVLIAPAIIGSLAWVVRLPARVRLATSCAALLLVLSLQPARAEMAWTFGRLPAYAAIVKGCQTIIGDARPVREIQLSFDAPYDTDASWLLSIMGGALRGGAGSYRAVIDRSGLVRYE